MLKLGSEDVDDALLPLEGTRLLSANDDAEMELDVGRLGVAVVKALPLNDDKETLVLEGKNGIPEVALEVELRNGGGEDGTGGA
jgi:hypothetical protein